MIDYELERYARLNSATVRFNAEARAAYVRFATSADAEWSGNFRELSASVSRMAILADGGRIGEADAGRKHFAATRSKRSSVNDSDQLRKYLARFDLEWARVGGRSL